jgi:hypothetical protein
VRRDPARVRNRQQLDKRSRQLDYVVLRAPTGWVTVAGANLEAQTTIEFNGSIEIAHRMYDVI